MRFTHLINPFRTEPGSEHDVAHRITFASIGASVDFATQHGIDVEVLGLAFKGECELVERPVRQVSCLVRSVLDIKTMKPAVRLPLITDLLSFAGTMGTGEYLIYTNIDIALQPDFYTALESILQTPEGPLACVINRRTIPGRYRSPVELSDMYAEKGMSHPGYDCFVFPRAWITQIDMGNACIGARHFDGLLIANLDLLSKQRLEIFRDLHLTFHIGDDRTWESRPDYDEYNMREVIKALRRMAAKTPPLPRSHFEFLHAGYMHNALPHHRFMRLLKRYGPLRKTLKIARNFVWRGHSKTEVAS